MVTLAKLAEAKTSTFETSIIAKANECGIARVVSIRDHVVRIASLRNELVQQEIVVERMPAPNVIPVNLNQQPEQRVANNLEFW